MIFEIDVWTFAPSIWLSRTPMTLRMLHLNDSKPHMEVEAGIFNERRKCLES